MSGQHERQCGCEWGKCDQAVVQRVGRDKCLQHNEELRAYYDKKREEGKVHGVALGAVCRKLLMRIYAILKENRVYEAHPA